MINILILQPGGRFTDDGSKRMFCADNGRG